MPALSYIKPRQVASFSGDRRLHDPWHALQVFAHGSAWRASCSLRGLDQVRSEWSLVTMAWVMKRMFVLGGAT